MKWGITALVLLVVIIGGSWYLLQTSTAVAPTEEEQTTPAFVYTNATADNIVVELPFPGAVVGKEFSVIGTARGYWFFEASFPVYVMDKDGNQLAVGLGSPMPAGTDWMTTEFIGFKADIVIPPTYTGPATIVVKNDNPSGLPENDKSVTFPIVVEY